MTTEEFMIKLESYYSGQLPDAPRGITLNYLREYREDKLPTLLGLVLKSHPIAYGCPAIAEIEKVHFAYMHGNKQYGIDGHSSLKADKKKSACAPVEEEEPATDEDVNEIISGLKEGAASLLQACLGEENQ